MELEVFVATRRGLHGVAELILAGPQHRRSGTIRLQATATGFATVAEPSARVEGPVLIAGSSTVRLNGLTVRQAAAGVGLDVVAPSDIYTDGSGFAADDVIALDDGAARSVCDVFAVGRAALADFAPSSDPVLWPEHFDLAITRAEVNYGVSPGDETHPAPYAYVGPWTPRQGSFWNAPFGAILPLGGNADAAAVASFFGKGEREAATDA